jgi:hypothetical protein
MKITKRPYGLLNYTKYHVKIPKYSQKQSFFFVFSETKSVILLYMEIEKTCNTLVQ